MHTHLHTHLPKESSYDSWEKKKVETEWLPGEGKGAALFLKPVSFLPSLKKSPKSGVNNTHSVQELVQERNMRQRVQCSSVPLLSLCSALMFFYRIINYSLSQTKHAVWYSYFWRVFSPLSLFLIAFSSDCLQTDHFCGDVLLSVSGHSNSYHCQFDHRWFF